MSVDCDSSLQYGFELVEYPDKSLDSFVRLLDTSNTTLEWTGIWSEIVQDIYNFFNLLIGKYNFLTCSTH